MEEVDRFDSVQKRWSWGNQRGVEWAGGLRFGGLSKMVFWVVLVELVVEEIDGLDSI